MIVCLAKRIATAPSTESDVDNAEFNAASIRKLSAEGPFPGQLGMLTGLEMGTT